MIDRLTIEELNQLIGNETLETIKRIIPFITDSFIQNINDIYLKKNLVNIFLSFSGEDIFSNQIFRRQLLGKLSLPEIQELAIHLNKNSDLHFSKLVDTIAKIPWSDNNETKYIIEFFKLPVSYVPYTKINTPNIEFLKKPDSLYKVLMDFQNEIFERSIEKMNHPLQTFLIQMPTGSGKTRTAMEIICTTLNQNPEKTVIWLANSEELCEQAVESFKDVWGHTGQFDIDVIRIWGDNKLIVPIRSSFIVCGFAKIFSIFKRKPELSSLLSKQTVLIIVDEAHQIVAPTYKKVIEMIRRDNYNAHLIGLTATPGRGDINNDDTNDLINYFAREKIEISSGEKGIFQYLRDKKILASIQRDPLETNIIFELTTKEKEYVRTNYDFPISFLENISSNDERNIAIINKLKSECKSNKKILFFAGSVAQSKFICATLNFLGLKAEHIDGTTKRNRRWNLLNQFREGDLNIICNFGVLTTGFDAPKIDVVFIARPTLSIVLYSQMIGRGLRGPAIGGKPICKLIDVVDSIEMYKNPDNVYDYFEQYWNYYD